MLKLKSYSTVIFLTVFSFIFLLQTLGLFYGWLISFYLILILPFFLYLFDYLAKVPLKFPKKLSITIIIFLGLLGISTYANPNIIETSRFFFLYTAFCLILLWVFNHKQEIYNPLIKLIFYFAVVLILFSLVLANLKLPFLDPGKLYGYQLVYPAFGSHNHLGDFLILPLLALFYLLLIKWKNFYLLLFLSFSIFFILAFSRSAYASFLAVVFFIFIYFMKLKKIDLRSSLFFATIFFVVFYMFFAIVKEFQYINPFAKTNQYLSENNILHPKQFGGKRLEYFNQALQSARDNPVFGIGLNNFYKASRKYGASPYYWTYSSHNLFLDILVEAGVLSLLAFMVFLSRILTSLDKTKVFALIFFIALLLNFQTDY
ncbi:O-antigen ligase family protein, partial [Candidatus Daviesbacteria bacterium]|nr:O-antigen ligase family protein [Candidatus Daviesbacteria bacterium]